MSASDPKRLAEQALELAGKADSVPWVHHGNPNDPNAAFIAFARNNIEALARAVLDGTEKTFITDLDATGRKVSHLSPIEFHEFDPEAQLRAQLVEAQKRIAELEAERAQIERDAYRQGCQGTEYDRNQSES